MLPEGRRLRGRITGRLPRLWVLSALIIVIIVAGAAVLAPLVAPYDPAAIDPPNRLLPPGSPGHVLGTDAFGRDVLSRLIWGGRISLLAGVIPAVATMILGVFFGLITGFIRGLVDGVVMIVVDILLAFPFMLLAIATVAVLGPSLQNAMIAIVIAVSPARIRLIRSEVMSLSTRPFVDAARVLGYSRRRILFAELLPNVNALAVATLTIDIALIMTATSALSFLGLGVQPPTSDWGTMIAEGRTLLFAAPYITVIPSILLGVVCVSFGILGDAFLDRSSTAAQRAWRT